MKRDTLLGFIAMVVILFALRSLLANDIEETYHEERKRNHHERNFCEECCKQGRFASTECCRQCGGCDMWDDEGASECRDYPE
jgi:hypothetical protein